MEEPIDAFIAGYLGVDLVCDFSNPGLLDMFKPGQLLEMEGISFALGGLVANTGMAMKKFGNKVYLSGLTGQDAFGRMVKDYLDNYQIGAGIRTTEKAGTACGIVVAVPGVDRIFLEYPGSNHYYDISCMPVAELQRSKIFHFGYPPLLRETYARKGKPLLEIFERAKKLGNITSLDFSLPDPASPSGNTDWQTVLRCCLPCVDFFQPSLEEAMAVMMPEVYAGYEGRGDEIIDLVSTETVRGLGRQILEWGAQAAVLKIGHRGIYLLTGDLERMETSRFPFDKKMWANKEIWCEAFPVEKDRIKNASGAGDTAIAAFLTALLNGEGPEKALQFAALAGRNNLYCMYLYEELPCWKDMEAELKDAKNKIKVLNYVEA